MKILILVNDGSPREVTMKSIWGDGVQVGVGGAELGLLTMCEAWHNAGHEVVLFNDPRELGASPFEQRMIKSYDPDEKRDVLINFRSPNPATVLTSNCAKFLVEYGSDDSRKLSGVCWSGT